MASKYVDTVSIMQVIGCVFNNPQLLELTDKYRIVEEDFSNDFHKIVFGAIYKLHELGAEKVTLENRYLSESGSITLSTISGSLKTPFREILPLTTH